MTQIQPTNSSFRCSCGCSSIICTNYPLVPLEHTTLFDIFKVPTSSMIWTFKLHRWQPANQPNTQTHQQANKAYPAARNTSNDRSKNAKHQPKRRPKRQLPGNATLHPSWRCLGPDCGRVPEAAATQERQGQTLAVQGPHQGPEITARTLQPFSNRYGFMVWL
jgi:hypothetical protein